MSLPSHYLTMQEVTNLVVEAGFRYWYVVTVTSMLWVESRGNVWAVGLNATNPSSPAYLSLDLGLCQWNTYYHPEITPGQAFSPLWSLAKMYNLTSGGVKNLGLWASYTSGAYRTYASDAYCCARAAGVPI